MCLETSRRASMTHGWSVGDRDDEPVFSSLNPQEGAISNAYQIYKALTSSVPKPSELLINTA